MPYLDLPEDYHFGHHVVVAAGYYPEKRQVLIADRDEGLHAIFLDTLEQARGSKFKPFPPQHAWWGFDFNNSHRPRAGDIHKAIREVSIRMLEPAISNFGVKGIQKTAEQVLKWHETMDDEQLRWTCFNTFVFIDATGGTGGGIFRYMYSRFLREAAGILGDERLITISDSFWSIGDRWQEVAGIFKLTANQDTDPKAILPKTTKPLKELADREEQVWEKLLTII